MSGTTTGSPAPRPNVLRTGPWRGAPLLSGAAWALLSGASLVVGLRSDPYAVGLREQYPLELVDGVAELSLRLGLVDAVADLTARAESGVPAEVAAPAHPVVRADVAARTETAAAPGRTVVVDSGAVAELTAYLDGSGLPRLDGEPAVPGLRLLDAVVVMDRLRSPGGCPWDAEQTHESLRPYLLEEAQEAVEAIDAGDRLHLAEELGDVLLQVLFHARVGQEEEHHPFDIDAVAERLVAKLVRRHPHVFGDVVADTPAQVAANWQRIKAAERAARLTGGGALRPEGAARAARGHPGGTSRD